MVSHISPSVLLVGVSSRPERAAAPEFYTASTLREAVATIRLIEFDLIVVGLDDPAFDVWQLMERVLGVWPQQRWMLASEQTTPEEEVLARSWGALMVLHETPHDAWLLEFASSLRWRRAARRMPSSAAFAPSRSDSRGEPLTALNP